MLQMEEKTVSFQKMKLDYSQLIISYFSEDNNFKKQLPYFVQTAFSKKLSSYQLIEIHMEIIDKFSQQLKKQGLSDEVLLDYRLPLLDILAHLCEAYRCAN